MHAVKVIVALICTLISVYLGNRQYLCAIAKTGEIGGIDLIATSVCVTYLVWFFFM
jgi:hypothetical protein